MAPAESDANAPRRTLPPPVHSGVEPPLVVPAFTGVPSDATMVAIARGSAF